jgi:hypothetical protein
MRQVLALTVVVVVAAALLEEAVAQVECGMLGCDPARSYNLKAPVSVTH